MRASGDQPLLVMTRVVPGPRPAVFDAWTRPERLARWWDPTGAPAARAIELRGDASYRVPVRNAAGAAATVELQLRELVRPERIVFTWGRDAATRTRVELTLTDAIDARGAIATRLGFAQFVLPRIAPLVAPEDWGARLARLESYLEEIAAA